MEIFKLFGTVLVETSGAVKSLKGVDSKAQGTMGKLVGFVNVAAGWATTIAKAVIDVGKMLYAAAGETSAMGDRIDKQSQRLGFTAQEYQEWEHILQHYGTSLDEVGQKIGNLYENVASRKEDTIETLELIGITLAEADSMTPEQLFSRVIDALQSIKSDGDRAAVAAALFGGKADALYPILNSSAEEVEHLRNEVHEIGGVMSDEGVKASADYQDSLLDVRTAWTGFKNNITLRYMPTLTKLNNWISHTAIPGLSKWSEGAGGVIDSYQLFTDWYENTGKPAWDASVKWIDENVIPALQDWGSEVKDGVQKAYSDFTDWLGDGWEESLAGVNKWIADNVWPTLSSWGEKLQGLWSTFTQTVSNWFSAKSQIESNPINIDPVTGMSQQDFFASMYQGMTGQLNPAGSPYAPGMGPTGRITINQNISAVPQTPAELAAASRNAFLNARWMTP